MRKDGSRYYVIWPELLLLYIGQFKLMLHKLTYTAIACSLVAQAAYAQTKDIVINGARIEVGDGTVIPIGSIVIHDGKISQVGATVSAPADAEIIDGKGWFIFPGFIEAYSTRGLKLPDAPAAGTPPDNRNTAPATMWHANRRGIRIDLVASKCLDIADRLKDSYSNGVTTALLAPGNGSLRGSASVIDYVDKGNVLNPLAAEEIALRGGGFGGGGGGGYPGTLLGVTALVRQVLADAQSYAANEPAKKDAGLENLKPLMNGQMPALFVADTAREIVRASRIAEEFGLRLAVMGGREGYRELDLLKAKSTPVILSLDVSDAPSKKVEVGSDATPQAVLDDRYNVWLEHSQNPKVLSEAGIPLAFTQGLGFGDYLPGVRKLITQGLSRDAALKAMTSGAAAILGVSDKVGSIQVGKLANLVIMNADFADEKSVIQTVIIEGKKIDVKKGGGK